MKTIEFLPAARGDYDHAFDWYLKRNAKVAEKFSAAIDVALKIVAGNPRLFATFDGVHRICLVRGFPYSIIYRCGENRIHVVAVSHASRDSGFWQGR